MRCSIARRISGETIRFFHVSKVPLVHSVIAIIARTVSAFLLPRKKLALACDALLCLPDAEPLELRLLPPLV